MPWEAVGRLEVVARCEGKGAPSVETFWLHELDEGKTRVSFGRLKVPEPGWVHLRGERSDSGAIVCSAWSRVSDAELDVKQGKKQKQRAIPAAADMSVLLVRVSIAGFSPVCSEDDLRKIMWRGESNARDFWSDLTYGQYEFLSDLDGDGRDDVASVTLDEAPASCEDVWPAVQQRLASMQPSRWQRRVLMLPADFRMCGWASASIGCDAVEGCEIHLTAVSVFFVLIAYFSSQTSLQVFRVSGLDYSRAWAYVVAATRGGIWGAVSGRQFGD